ncbi:hypothetical protein LAV79_06895 [Peribacillus butanolivorans]|uniref:hypothetical protein n=1 Tax=Peribacillus butanolivorans TaxID=421767 RepID=UPI0030C9DC2C
MINLIIIYTNIKEVEHASFDLFPFSIYLGWVSVAAIADISYYLTYISWKGFEISNVTGTIVMMIAATILAFVSQLKTGIDAIRLSSSGRSSALVYGTALSTRQSPLYPTSWLF